ncbi:MAG: hypothetical protein AB1603_06950 [Chloroflexota bacterium]
MYYAEKLAEREGSSGRDFLTSVVIGYEVMAPVLAGLNEIERLDRVSNLVSLLSS